MKTGRIVLFLIVLSILWCADVFAHDDGNPVAHFCPGTDDDPCWGDPCGTDKDENGNDTKTNKEYKGGHGHVDRTVEVECTIMPNVVGKDGKCYMPYDKHMENGEHVDNASRWGYWNPEVGLQTIHVLILLDVATVMAAVMATVMVMATATATVMATEMATATVMATQRQPTATVMATVMATATATVMARKWQRPAVAVAATAAAAAVAVAVAVAGGNGGNDRNPAPPSDNTDNNGGNSTMAGTTAMKTQIIRTTMAGIMVDNNGGNNGGNNGNENTDNTDTVQDTEPELKETGFFAFELSLDAGWNFVHIPLEVTQVDGQSMSIETLGNLFPILMPTNMYVYDGSCWMEVFGDSTQGLGTTQGVAVYMDAPKTVNLVGSPLPTSFSLERGLNFVGLPRQSAALRKVSDFLTFYPDVCAVLIASEGELYLVGRAGDSGDVEITGGQAFGIIAVEQYMTSFGGAAWGKVLLE